MVWTIWIALGSLSAALSVGLGAFGAHALKQRLTPEDLQIFEVGVRYQMYHAFALLAVGFLALRIDNLAVRVAGVAFIVGSLLFSGSLYGLAFGAPRWTGVITPFGGVGFLIGWIALAWAVLRTGAPS
jgi:uncharacterized membrane protein YgdD (TMEM256/DUF423 family)